MRRVLLILWIATIGADRFDLFAGKGGFMMTPFLVLSPLVIIISFLPVIANWRNAKVKLPANTPVFAALLIILAALMFISVPFSGDAELSVHRYFLFLAQVTMTVICAVIIYNCPKPRQILLGGALIGMMLCAAFDIGQLLYWFDVSVIKSIDSTGLLRLQPASIGGIVPRLTVVSLDPNRGGMVLVVYAFLIWNFGRSGRMRTMWLWIIPLLLLVTLSRSALMGGFLLALTLVLQGRIKASMVVKTAAVIIILALAGSYFMISGNIVDSLSGVRILTERVSFGESVSGGIHMDLLERAIEVANKDVKNLLFGIGFGSSYTVLDDVFPNNEYGNFHSMYLSVLVESGALALIVFLALILLPLTGPKAYLPILVPLLWFNVFYQMNLEPMFWFALTLAWGRIGIAPVGKHTLNRED